LAAGEGVETMLSLRVVLPALPIVAALSATHLAGFIPPTGLRRLYIARDNDRVGRRAAEMLGARADADGIEALALTPRWDDRADCENVFDELKNQWGWGGFTTHDLKRCRLAARMVALVYNWWNIFVRLAEPDKHLEAITSRPLLLAGIAERTRHGRQTTLRIASTHGRAGWAQRVLTGVARFLRRLIDAAEQLTADQRWARILAHAVRSWLKGRRLRAPPRLMTPA